MEPQTYDVLVSPRAFADLDAIADYVAARSPGNAAKLIDRLWAAMQGRGEFPQRL